MLHHFFKTISDSLRFLMGPSGVCIYPVTCREYAWLLLQEKRWYKAMPLIVFRLVSCNPLIGWWKRRK